MSLNDAIRAAMNRAAAQMEARVLAPQPQPWPYGPRLAHVPSDSRPKSWEGPPVTPVPEAYGRLLAEFPAQPTGAERILVAVLELHGPKPVSVGFDGVVWRWQCEGCELDGYEAEHPEWPCETTHLIAGHLDVVMT